MWDKAPKVGEETYPPLLPTSMSLPVLGSDQPRPLLCLPRSMAKMVVFIACLRAM